MKESLGEEGNESVKSSTSYVCLNGTSQGAYRMQSAELPWSSKTTFKSGRDINAEMNKMVWMDLLKEDARRPTRQEDTTTCEGKHPHVSSLVRYTV